MERLGNRLTNFLEEVSHRTGVYKGSAQEQERDHQQQQGVHLHRRHLNESSCLFALDFSNKRKFLPRGADRTAETQPNSSRVC
jgi:hypothetical protein